MSVLIFLIPLTLVLSLLGVAGFLWSLKTKQFEDLDGAASRILFDDVPVKKAPISSTPNS
jgi:cbb3-type cytochrome oxidase maturation protein